MTRSFDGLFTDLFHAQFPRLFRFLDRLSGDPDLATDLAQEAFVRLFRRGSLPDAPEAWLVTVAMNLFRNARVTRTRRLRLLPAARAEGTLADPPVPPDRVVEADELRPVVRRALDQLDDRERELLLLRSAGFSYREIAMALRLNEASVGTLLARAKHAFRAAYTEAHPAPVGDMPDAS